MISMHLSDKKIRYSLLFFFALAVLAVLVVPMLLLSRYNAPFADDFSFSCETHRAVSEGLPILSVISAAWSKVKDVYYTWQGTFTGVFMMAFQPGIFGLKYYSLTTLIMLIGFGAGSLFFFFALFSRRFGMSKYSSGLIWATVFAICIQYVPSPNQSFYWYNGAVFYTFTFGLFLTLCALASDYAVIGGTVRVIFLCILAVITGGSNYVTALETVILLTLAAVLSAFSGNRRWRGLLAALIFAAAALAVSAVAPGNAVRQSEFSQNLSAVMAIVLSFKYAFHYAISWITFPYIGMIAFLVPVMWFASDPSRCSFRLPGFFSAFSFCIFASMFTPHLFAKGTEGPERLINILYFSFIILSVLNLFLWCGYLKQRRAAKKGQSIPSVFVSSLPLIPAAAGTAALIICIGFGIVMHTSPMTSLMALGEMRSGEAEAYYSEMLERQDILEDDTVRDCSFAPLSEHPYLLFFGDMTEDENFYANGDASTFYHKNSIKIVS